MRDKLKGILIAAVAIVALSIGGATIAGAQGGGSTSGAEAADQPDATGGAEGRDDDAGEKGEADDGGEKGEADDGGEKGEGRDDGDEKGEADEQITGPTGKRASAAAREATGGGRVTEVQAADEGDGGYEVKVKRSDGSFVEVAVDPDFTVVSVEEDDD